MKTIMMNREQGAAHYTRYLIYLLHDFNTLYLKSTLRISRKREKNLKSAADRRFRREIKGD